MTRLATHSLPLTLALLLSVLTDVDAAPHRTRTEPFKIDLVRRTSKTAAMSNDEWLAWANNHRENLKVKYGGPTATASANERRATSGVNLLINQDADSSYIGSLAVGTPPTSYNVILDTGSSDFWLASPQCTTCGTTPTFSSSSSSSFTQLSSSFDVQYGSGAVSGILGEDTVQMAGFSVANQPMGVCDDVSQDFLSDPVSGLMGLGWQQLSSSGAMPLWETLASSGAWSEPLMAFALTRFINQSGTQALEPGGVFTMGATNSTLFTGDIEYTDIPTGQEGYWLLPIQDLSVSGSTVSIPSSEAQAAIDTGTTLIAGPQDVVENFYAQIPGSEAVQGAEGYFAYPCTTDVSMSLNFGSSDWAVASSDFVSRQLSRDLCVGALFAINLTGTATPSFIVGDTFLKNVYTVFRFDPPSVGFAQLSAAANALSTSSNPQDALVPSATINGAPLSVTATATVQQGGGSDERSSSAGPSRPLSWSAVVAAISVVVGAALL